MRVQNEKGDLWYVYWRYNHKLKPKINKHLQVVFDHIPISTECYIRNKDKEVISTGISRVYKIDRSKYTKAEGRQRSFDKALNELSKLDNSIQLEYFYAKFDQEIKNKIKLTN